MKSEDKIVELLSDMLIKQDRFIDGLDKLGDRVGGVEREIGGVKKEMGGLKKEMGGLKREFGGVKSQIQELNRIQIRQENLMMKMLEILDEAVPKFDQIIYIEHLKDGTVVLKRHQ